MTCTSIEKKSLSSLIDLEFPFSFFNDEVREGFYVSGMMKRYWAGQLKVLSEIVKICDVHNIPWFVDYGTLIGAVRHGGFIPWDDDLDICMLREDYDLFVKYAEKELPEDYSILTLEKESEYTLMLGRVVNGKDINYGKNRLEKFYGCPYTIGVDIFPLDGLSKDKNKEEERILLCKELVIALNLLYDGKQDTAEGKSVLANIERHHHVILNGKNIEHELLLLTEKMYKRFSTTESDDVVLAPFWIKNGDHRFPKKLFQDSVELKFENISVKVSALYEQMLTIEYGDYMTIHRAGGIHDYPVYRDQEMIMTEHIGHKPFRYSFSDGIENYLDFAFEKETEEDGSVLVKNGKKDFDKFCREIVTLLKISYLQMKELYLAEEHSKVCQLFEECQSLAITLGNEIEKRYVVYKDTITLLEKYCEEVYICHEGLADGTFAHERFSEIEIFVKKIEDEITKILLNRTRRILFLPCSPIWWKSMSDIYSDRILNPNNECSVIPIPCYQKDLEDRIIGLVEDAENYPDEVAEKTLKRLGIGDTALFTKLWTVLDFKETYYDEIVIQFPFDSWNRSMTIPPQFCSDELVKHTDLLTYSPCLVPVFPEGGDAKLYTSLKTLVEQPTVIYSDTVILHSQQEKEAYQSIADELTGGKNTRYWNEKFSVINTDENKKSKSDNSACGQNKAIDRDKRMDELGLPGDFRDKKILLYHIGISSLLENKDCAVERLKETVSDITDNQDRIKCIFSPGKNVSELEHIDPDLWTKYKAFIDELSQDDRIYLDDKGDALAYIDIVDGYYGDGDVVAHRCRNKGIPVMIRKADMG